MVGSAEADEMLYCQSELATGLSKQDGTWKTYDFPNEGWTIKGINDFEAVVGLFEKEAFP